MNELDGADIHSTGGLGGDEQTRVGSKFAGDDDFLLVTTGQGLRRCLYRRCADVIVLDEFCGEVVHGFAVADTLRRELLLIESIQHHVVGDGVLPDNPVLLPIFRDMSDAEVVHIMGAEPERIRSVHHHRRRLVFAQTCQRLHQLALPVALNACDANNLSGFHRERNIADRWQTQTAVDVEALHIKHDVFGHCRLLVDPQQNAPAHHHLGQARLVCFVRGRSADDLSSTQHLNGVRESKNFPEFVGDEDDCDSVVREATHHLEKLVCFLRRENRGWLIHDQDFCFSIQSLQDLYPLLGAHGEVFDFGVHIDFEPILFGQACHLCRRFLHVDENRLMRFVTENDVLRHGEHRHQLEMLMHHADATANGVARTLQRNLRAIHENLALVRLVQPVDHLDQGRLTRTVFSQQPNDLTLVDSQRHVVVGDDSGKALGDAAGFENRRSRRVV